MPIFFVEERVERKDYGCYFLHSRQITKEKVILLFDRSWTNLGSKVV